jgi:creatinine amidohydrolase
VAAAAAEGKHDWNGRAPALIGDVLECASRFDVRSSAMTRTAIVASLLLLASASPGAEQPPAQGGRGQRGPADPRNAGGGNCAANAYNCVDTPNPLAPPDTVWMEDMTWMDVRDAMKAGKKTVVVSTGGIEPNGPWLALGKHNFVLRANCDAIARKLGDALCAPIVPFVPEGSIEPKSSHMLTVGTISLEEATFEALLTDIVRSYKMHGFENIILIGDSGGNQDGMKAVADKLNAQWHGKPVVAHIPEYYAYNTVAKLLLDLGVSKADGPRDNLHDDPGISLNMFITDPHSIRWEQRVKAGKATIDGVSLADKAKNLEIGRKIVEMRATNTVAAIKKAIAERRK